MTPTWHLTPHMTSITDHHLHHNIFTHLRYHTILPNRIHHNHLHNIATMKRHTVTARAVGLFSWILLACNGINAFTTPASQRIYLHRIHHVTSRSLHVSTRINAMPQVSQADIDTLSSKGYVVIPNFISRDLVEELREDIRDLCSNNAFCEAKIGQDSTNDTRGHFFWHAMTDCTT